VSSPQPTALDVRSPISMLSQLGWGISEESLKRRKPAPLVGHRSGSGREDGR